MGLIVEDPVRRQRLTFSRTGDVLRAEVTVDPGGDVPLHRHPHQEERFEVVDGQATFRVGRHRLTAGPGDRVAVPARTWHSFRNRSAQPARLVVEVEPALGMQGFLEEAALLARRRLYTRRGIPRGPRAALTMLRMLGRHRETTEMAFPPPFVIRLLGR